MKTNAYKKVTFVADPDDEAFALENGFDIAVPVYFVETVAGELYVECYPQIEALVRAHVDQFGGTLLSHASLSSLHKALAPFLLRWGYTDDCHRMRRYEIFRASGEPPLDENKIVQGTRLLSKKETLTNRTTLRLADLADRRMTACGYVEDGALLAYAVTHSYPDKLPTYVEVSVETAPSARGRGLATSALLLLRKELAKKKRGVEYRAAYSNHPSRHVARRAGLSLYGRCYYYVLRRDYTATKKGI